MPACDRFTPETCPCNVHSAARAQRRADAVRRGHEDAARQPTDTVRGLEDSGPPTWEDVSAVGLPFNPRTLRLAVPGGWLYGLSYEGRPVDQLTFVPHPL